MGGYQGYDTGKKCSYVPNPNELRYAHTPTKIYDILPFM